MYTFKPKERHAKLFARDVRISDKNALKLSRAIRGKTLKRAKRLLENLANKKQSLAGKYYTKTAKEMIKLLNSCEKNAESLGLDNEKLFVHASAHQGSILRRRRRKAAFGSRLKSTNLEIILIERGKEKKEAKPEAVKEIKEAKPGKKSDVR